MSNAHENAGSYKKADFCIMYLYATAFFLFCRMDRRERTAVNVPRFPQAKRDRHRTRRFAKQTNEAQLRFSFSTKEKDREQKVPCLFLFVYPSPQPHGLLYRENVNMHGINPGKRYFLVKKDNNQAFSSACGFLNR